MTLIEEAASFLTAEGWLVTRRDTVLLSATRAGLGDDSDQTLVWVPERLSPEQLRLREDAYMRRFEEQARIPGKKYFLLESTEGLSAEFRRQAFREFGVSLQIPTNFFDAPFRWDRSRVTGTAASDLRNRGNQDLRDRIPQPFMSSRGYQSSDDLLPALLREFRPFAEGPPVHLVTAPAGFGKSLLFRSVFASLYTQFIAAKNAGIRSLRPLPLIPEYLPSASAATLKALVASFLTTEVARPLSLESFEWMLTHRYACFLLDGLDEVVVRDPSFFEYIYELLTLPETPYTPKVLICVRDSLLVSNKGLRDFLEYAGRDMVHHQLTAWQRPSVATYVRRRLGEPRAEWLMQVIDGNKNLLELAGTPFYCETFTSEVSYGLEPAELTGAASETRLLALAVHRMIQREFDKGLLRNTWASVKDIESLIKDIAEYNLKEGGKGVSVDDVGDIAQYSLATGLAEGEIEEAIEHILQLPFLTGGTDLERLSFTQEVVYDYLLGMLARDYFSSHPKQFLQLLNAEPFSPDSATLHVIREHILDTNALEDLYLVAMDAIPDPIAFRNVLQLLLSVPSEPETEWIMRRLPLERRDLSALRFSGMDLNNVSFRSSNLEAATFDRCSLSSAVLADAALKGTSFRECEGVGTADFGDLSTFFSATVNGETFEEPDEFLRAIGIRTGPEGPRYIQPCDAANQVRFLFGKYVRPDGVARRDWLDEKAALAGKRYIDPKRALDAACHHGYLTREPDRRRYTRSRGDQYSDMIGLVSKLQITPRLRHMLVDLCDVQGCNHILNVDNDR
jgi:hypothetical protein